ncbi:mediator of RNA polymerase II transcription subunit 26 [Nasonia vitripennis]|uniref:Mediator of RNA polymerase II transcription subunit 26 n=1 Tax=Nasonia vitripennis TaxID=7425 RepID=A0A7M7GC90_NASVI|nr:mediator of RNA polymerase II transcription subunit 26 [Nasonia vitripennis]
MQRHCTELTERLLQSLDEEYNVVDMGVVVDVITALEKTTITKEVLEITRLGRYVNELRRKTHNQVLAKRAKELVRRWRNALVPSANATPQPPVADTAPPALNGANAPSPALRCLEPQSPALRGLKPQSPLMRTTSLSRVSSPLLHSDQSHSPVVSPNKPQVTATNNHRLNSNTAQVDVKFGSQNHSSEAVPRTHSSNKRLRKDEPVLANVDVSNKKQRLNGESVCGSNENLQVPSPTFNEKTSELVEPSSSTESNVVKKRGRKKGSKSIKNQVSVEDSVKEKLASISRNKKLKTTQELLADLQARGSNANANLLPSHSVNQPKVENNLRTKNNEDLCKYLSGNQNNSLHKKATDVRTQQQKSGKRQENTCHSSQQKYPEPDVSDQDTVDSEITSENNGRLPQELTVEEILAKLPPLDRSSIDWGSGDEYCSDNENETKKVREVTEEDLDRLHNECIEGLNGNFQPRLSFGNISETEKTCEDEVKLDSVIGLRRRSDSHKDEVFREWHEMLAKPSFDGQILHILPYVIID